MPRSSVTRDKFINDSRYGKGCVSAASDKFMTDTTHKYQTIYKYKSIYRSFMKIKQDNTKLS